MKDTELFAAALALKSPWYIKKIDFRDTAQGEKELHIEVDHHKRVKFEYEGSCALCTIINCGVGGICVFSNMTAICTHVCRG